MYESLKKEILGEKYSLSVAFVDEKKSRELNKKYRGKDKPSNVLAFPLSKKEGEVLLCKPVIRKEAKNFGKTPEEFLSYLVIHAMLHLKGMRHGSIMEKREKFYCTKYDKEYFRRHRRGLRYNQSRSGRVSKRRKKS